MNKQINKKWISDRRIDSNKFIFLTGFLPFCQYYLQHRIDYECSFWLINDKITSSFSCWSWTTYAFSVCISFNIELETLWLSLRTVLIISVLFVSCFIMLGRRRRVSGVLTLPFWQSKHIIFPSMWTILTYHLNISQYSYSNFFV